MGFTLAGSDTDAGVVQGQCFHAGAWAPTSRVRLTINAPAGATRS